MIMAWGARTLRIMACLATLAFALVSAVADYTPGIAPSQTAKSTDRAKAENIGSNVFCFVACGAILFGVDF